MAKVSFESDVYALAMLLKDDISVETLNFENLLSADPSRRMTLPALMSDLVEQLKQQPELTLDAKRLIREYEDQQILPRLLRDNNDNLTVIDLMEHHYQQGEVNQAELAKQVLQKMHSNTEKHDPVIQKVADVVKFLKGNRTKKLAEKASFLFAVLILTKTVIHADPSLNYKVLAQFLDSEIEAMALQYPMLRDIADDELVKNAQAVLEQAQKPVHTAESVTKMFPLLENATGNQKYYAAKLLNEWIVTEKQIGAIAHAGKFVLLNEPFRQATLRSLLSFEELLSLDPNGLTPKVISRLLNARDEQERQDIYNILPKIGNLEIKARETKIPEVKQPVTIKIPPKGEADELTQMLKGVLEDTDRDKDMEKSIEEEEKAEQKADPKQRKSK